MVDRVADISSSINLILESMYKKPMTIIKLLEDIGLSKTDIDNLQFSHIREFEDIVLDSIDEYFQMAKYRNDFNILVRRLGLRTRIETLQEIGDEYGVTRESIRQRQNKALRKLAIPKLKIIVEEGLLNKVKSIIYSSRKYRKFDTYDKAKKYVSENPGSDIAILDNDEGYLAKIVKTQSGVTKEIQSKALPSNPNKSSQSNKTVDDYLRSMSLRYFADKSQCVTHRIKHCILNETKDFGSLYEFVYDRKTRQGVFRIKQFGRKSFGILNECVENYIENIKLKLRKDTLKNEINTVTISNKAQANKLRETNKVESEYFKIEDFTSTRLINLQWAGGFDEILAIREENMSQGNLINRGVPISIEEIELYEDFVAQGKSVDDIKDYLQRSTKSLDSALLKLKEGSYKKYQTVYWKTSIDYDTGELVEFGDAVNNPFKVTTEALESVKNRKNISHTSEFRNPDNDNWEVVSGTFKEIVKTIKNDRPNHLAIIQNGCFYEMLDEGDISFFVDRFSYNSSTRWGGVAFVGFPTSSEKVLPDLRNMKKPFVLVSQLPEKDEKGKTLRAISEVYNG